MNGLFSRARSLWLGLRRPDRLEAEMDEEMRFHIDMMADLLVRERGVEPREAKRQAAAAFGGVEKYKEAGRDARGVTWITATALDFKLGARMLVKYPGLSLVGGLGMAVAIAIGAAVFSFVDVIIRPTLPLNEGDRIVAIKNMNVATGQDEERTHLHDLAAWRRELRAVEGLGAYRTVDRNLLTPDGRAEPLRIAEITASGFVLTRVPPLMGRQLVISDEEAGAPPVVVIGYEVWRNRFGSRAGIIGEMVQLGATKHMIVGVMPDGFAFPVNNRVWAPLRLDPLEFTRGEAPAISVFGRLAPGYSLTQAEVQLAAIGRRLAAEHAQSHEHIRPRIMAYGRHFLDSPEVGWVFYLVQLLASLFLVVIAINAAVLVYARTATRAGEIAVRLALGATRGRIVTQLFAEALVLAFAAALVGLVVARFALHQVDSRVEQVGGEGVPFWWNFGLSARTLLYVAGLTVLAALIVGVLPALRATGHRMHSTLRALGGATGMRMGKTWTVLIVFQVGAAVTILPVALALGWKEIVQPRAATAYSTDDLYSAIVGMDRETPKSVEAEGYDVAFAARFADRHAGLAARLGAEPGVTAVTFASRMPGSEEDGRVEVEVARPAAEPAIHEVGYLEMDPRLLGVLQVPVLAGRPFQAADVVGSATAVIANRTFVERVLGGGSGLGRRLRYTRTNDDLLPGGVAKGGWYEIVGVVPDITPGERASGQGKATLYHPSALGRLNPVTLIVRAEGVSSEQLAGRIRAIATQIDPAMRLGELHSFTKLQREERRTRRLVVLGVATVTLSILLFSAAGVHALMSFTVSQRRKEIGIRTALGAQPRRILAAVFSRALRQLGAGVAVGCLLGGALLAGSGFTAASTAVLLLAVAGVILIVGLLAAAGPARRGLRLEPMRALREQ